MGKIFVFCRIKRKFCSWLYKKSWHTSRKFQVEIRSKEKDTAKKPLTKLHEMNISIVLVLGKGQGPWRVIFGPVKSQNMNEEKVLLVFIFVTYGLQLFLMCIRKKSQCPLSWFFNVPKSGKKPKNSKDCHFSPIFGD